MPSITLDEPVSMLESMSGIANQISYITIFLTICISIYSISAHLRNYRQPSQQRLIIRIQLMIPLYAISCLCTISSPPLPKVIASFFNLIVEVYEAFVIYTFFSLLTVYLGDERDIIIKNSGKEPVKHLILGAYLPLVDISDPFTFLAIKRGILQYVWLKPMICMVNSINELWLDNNPGVYSCITVIYNLSVSVSLYDLALFWSCLYSQLSPFKPWGKFLNVKLIIFASYWQTLFISLLNFFGIADPDVDYQAYLMSWELLGFAISHLTSFSYREYDSNSLQGCSRFPFLIALKDATGIQDLLFDFKKTFYGSSYDYRSFDSVESVIAHPSSQSRLKRLNHGMRYSGDTKYWIKNNSAFAQDPPTSVLNMKTPLLASDYLTPNAIDSSAASIRGCYSPSVYSNNNNKTNMHPSFNSKSRGGSIVSYGSNDSGKLPGLSGEDFDEELLQVLSEYVYESSYYDVIKSESPFGDRNSPVVYDYQDYAMSAGIRRLRQERNMNNRNSRGSKHFTNMDDLV